MKWHLFSLLAVWACTASMLRADRLIFDNGDRLTGTYVGQEENEVLFDSPLVGQIRVSADTVTVERDLPALPPEIAPVDGAAGPTAERVEPPRKRPRFPRWNRFWEDNIFFETLGEVYPLMAWDNKIEFGFDRSFAQVNSSSVVIRFQTEREFDEWAFRFESSYEFAETTDAQGDDTRTTDRIRGSSRIRRDINEDQDFFVQSNTRYNRDLITRIYHEAEQTFGVGYRWLDTGRWNGSVVSSAGAGYREIGSDEGRVGYVATLFQDFGYQLSESVSLREESNLSYAPTSSDRSAYVFTALGELQTRLNSQLSLNMRYEFLYDQRIENPEARTSQRITWSLGAEF